MIEWWNSVHEQALNPKRAKILITIAMSVYAFRLPAF